MCRLGGGGKRGGFRIGRVCSCVFFVVGCLDLGWEGKTRGLGSKGGQIRVEKETEGTGRGLEHQRMSNQGCGAAQSTEEGFSHPRSPPST